MRELALTADFSLIAYSELLREVQFRGYEVRDFATVDPQSRHIILRHDLDMSLEAALPMARIEHDFGVQATYFVLLRSEFYNIMSPRGMEILNELLNLNHKIGLHLDVAGHPEEEVDAAALFECEILERILTQPVEMISFHRPVKPLFSRSGSVAGRRHTYEPAFVTEMGYCSDSRGAWHYGHPLDHPCFLEGRALQLLTHPIWWAMKSTNARKKLLEFLDMRLNDLDRNLALECQTHVSGRLGTVSS